MNQNCLSLLVVLWIVLPSFNFAQTAKDSTRQVAPEPLELAPEFPGGIEALYKVIEDSLNYPVNSLAKNVGGRVVVQFVIDTLGQPTKITIIDSVNPEIDQEAIRLIGLLKNWTPGMYHGKKVSVQYWLPLTFHPDSPSKKRNKKRKPKE